jgi:hypothetical protein
VVIQIDFAEVGGGALLDGRTFVRCMLQDRSVVCIFEKFAYMG